MSCSSRYRPRPGKTVELRAFHYLMLKLKCENDGLAVEIPPNGDTEGFCETCKAMTVLAKKLNYKE